MQINHLQMSIDFTALHLNILDLFKPELCRGSKYYAAWRLLRDKYKPRKLLRIASKHEAQTSCSLQNQ